MLRREEFDLLDELRKHGPLPHQLEQRHQRLRRQQFFKAGLLCDHYPPSSPSRLIPDMTVADWLRARWSSADASVRHSLRLLAEALGIPLPLARTQPPTAKDSRPARRTKIAPQPYVEHNPLLADPAGRKEPGCNAPPEWHDDDADGWTPCASLHDALHPDDRGWY